MYGENIVMLNILIVEDEKPIANLISISLENAGYQCDLAFSGTEALEYIDSKIYDLILLDIMLPEVDGFELMDYIYPLDIPVIFLTAKSDVKDKVRGLNMGAEDYIVKPFDVAELLARVDVVLRRYNKKKMVLNIKDLEINLVSRSVKKNNKDIPLTPKEFDLLALFAQNPNIALFRDVIYERVWGGDYEGDSRTVDLHIQRMRKKVGLEMELKTIYKVGYRLELKDED